MRTAGRIIAADEALSCHVEFRALRPADDPVEGRRWVLAFREETVAAAADTHCRNGGVQQYLGVRDEGAAIDDTDSPYHGAGIDGKIARIARLYSNLGRTIRCVAVCDFHLAVHASYADGELCRFLLAGRAFAQNLGGEIEGGNEQASDEDERTGEYRTERTYM